MTPRVEDVNMVEQQNSEVSSLSDLTDSYYVSRAGQTVGPVPAGQVVQWMEQGMLDAHVRAVDSGAWVHIQQSPFAAKLQLLARRRGPDPLVTPATRRHIRPGAWFWGCLHFLRWCCAACIAFSLSAGIVTVMCVSAPMSVLDSRDFWVKWATLSPVMASAHEEIDSLFDSAKQKLQAPENTTIAYLGDPRSMAVAFDRARPAVHDAIAGHVIDAVIGFVTGRDDQLQLDLGLPDLRKRISREITEGYATAHCGSGASDSAGCIAGKVALSVGASNAVWDAVSASLGDYNPFSGAFISNLIPGLLLVRTLCSGVRMFLSVAPFLFVALGLVLLFTSLRMKTACFMFGWALSSAGALSGVIGWCARELAEFFGMSPQVWNLVAAESGMVKAGVGADVVLMAIGLVLLVTRVFGPRWRRAFWQRRLNSPELKVASLAQERLSKPAGLLEPFHVVTAPKA